MSIRIARRVMALVLFMMSVAVLQSVTARPIIVIRDPQIRFYPGSFPCPPGPGYCTRYIILGIAAPNQPVNQDYTTTGNVQMAASVSQSTAYLADITGVPVLPHLVANDNDVVIPTYEMEGGL